MAALSRTCLSKRGRETPDPPQRYPAGLHPYQIRPGGGVAAQLDRTAHSVRGPDEGGDRTCLFDGIHEDAPRVPLLIDGDHRRRGEHDRGDDADRRLAPTVAEACDRAASAAEAAATDQRGNGEQSPTACRPKRRSGA